MKLKRSFIAQNSYRLEKGKLLRLKTLQKIPIFHISVVISRTKLRLGHSLHKRNSFIYIQLFWNTLTHDAKMGFIAFKLDEKCISISLMKMKKKLLQKEVHANHARIVSGPDPEPMSEDKLDQTLENYMCLLLDQTLSTWMMNSSGQPTQRRRHCLSSPINTEATTITTSLPEITPFIALQLRVARLEQEMSEVKKTDHSADVLASIKSQFLMIYRETYSLLPEPESIKNQNLKRVHRRLSESNGENRVRRNQDSNTPSGQQDKVALKEFDLRSRLKTTREDDSDDDEGTMMMMKAFSWIITRGRSAREKPESAASGPLTQLDADHDKG
ncbi:hypothetical protein Tco_1484825 [Tanacetum coccineum]